MITWVGYTHILRLMFFYVLRGCSCSTVIILYVMLLCCDLLWTGGVVWMSMRQTTANPRNPQANYGIGDRDGHMSMQISQFKGCTVMSTR